MNKASLHRLLNLAAKGILYILVLSVIAGTALFLFLQTRPARDWARRALVTQLEKATHARVHIGELRGNLLTDVALADVRITAPSKSDPTYTAKRISVSYYLPMLLFRTIDIYRLQIDGFNGEAIRRPDGTWNFASLIPKESDSGHAAETVKTGFTLKIHRLIVHRSRFILSDQTGAETVRHRFEQIECRSRLTVGRAVAANISHISFTSDKPPLTLRDLSGRVVYDIERHRLSIKNGRIRTPESAVGFTTTISFAKTDPVFDIKAGITALSPAEIGRLFSIPAASSGVLTGELEVKGTSQQLQHQLRLKWEGLSLTTRGDIYLSGKKAPGLAVTGRIEHADPENLPFYSISGLFGDINAGFSINGRDLSSPGRTGRIHIKATDSKLSGYAVRLANLAATVTGADVRVEKLDADTPCGTLNAKGQVSNLIKSGVNKPFSATVAIKGLNPAEFKGMNPNAAGNINLAMSIDGHLPRTLSMKDADMRVSATVNDSVYRDLAQITGGLSAVYKAHRLTVDRIAISSPAGHITGAGFTAIDSKKCQATISAELSDIKKLSGLVFELPENTDAAGKASITARLDGTWDHPIVDGRIQGAAIAFDRYHADRLTLSGKYSGGLSDYTASCQANVTGFAIGALHFPAIRIQTGVTPATLRLKGRVTDEKGDQLKIDGRTENWRKPEKQITVNQLALTSRKLPPLVNHGPIQLILQRQKLTFAAFHLVSGKTMLKLDGEIPLIPDGPVSAHLVLEHFDVGRVAELIPGNVTIGGIASADVSVSKSLQAPEISGHVHLANASGYGVSFSRIDFESIYKDARTVISLRGIQNQRKVIDLGGSLQVRLSAFPLKWRPAPGSEISLHLVLDRFDMGPIAALLPGGKNIKGRISADINMSQSLQNPVIGGRVELSDVSGYGIHFSALRLQALYQNDKTMLSLTGLRKDKKVLDINGYMKVKCSGYPFQCTPVPGGLHLTLSATGFSLSEFKLPQLKDINLFGDLNVQARITGDITDPAINGDIRITRGHVKLPELGLNYAQLDSDIHISPGTIHIKNISLNDKENGTLTGTGTITYHHWKPESIDLVLKGENFYVPFRNAAFVRAKPDLTLTGPISAPVLKGDIAVTKGDLYMEKLFANHPAEIEVINAPKESNGVLELPESSGQLSLIKPLAADITVTVKNDVWLKSKEENIEIAGQINLKKKSGHPFVIIGALNALRGTYLFRNHVFKITYGQLSFMGLEEINPILNIQARTRVDNAEIIIHLSGTFSNLKMKLDSDPAMDQVDIVSYLMFGRPADTLSKGESYRAEDAALSITGQLAAEQIQSILGKSFHLDMVHITTGNGNISQGSVSVGKYVAPNVFVTYNQGFSSTNPDRSVEVNYEFDRSFSIEAQISEEKTSAVDLIWHHDF